MVKKRSNLRNTRNFGGVKDGFVKVDLTDKDSLAIASAAMDEYQIINRVNELKPGLFSTKAARTTYQDIDSYTSVRDQFHRSDYEYFRTHEAIPTKPKDIMRVCGQAYRKVGIVRNIVDLMGDFGADGVRIVHPNPRIEKFYRGWFKKVEGPKITERFLNLLYRLGNVIVKRATAKINIPNEKTLRALGVDKLSTDLEFEDSPNPDKRTVPYRYTFLNPLTLEVIGENLSCFTGKLRYAIRIDHRLRSAVQHPKNKQERELAEQLPDDIKSAIMQKNQSYIPLDPAKISAHFYKKDDWQVWADPLIYAILDDLFMLEKMRLTDLSALDGAISQVRLWKLGDLEQQIFPTAVAVAKLAEILLSNPGGGAFDLIWGPELTLEETGTEVHKFLGTEKYQPVLNSIYAGLGVPPTLTGAATASGFTNNYISLQTLIQRLEYGRSIVRAFWEQEIELVRRAMGFRRGAYITFDYMTLSDEAAQKNLLIQLVDRDLLDFETVLERFGEIPEVVKLKLRKDQRSRKLGSMSEKASPYHTAEKLHERIITALRAGYITPEQSGIEIPVELKKDKTPFEKQLQMRQSSKNQGGFTPSKKGKPTTGRPYNSKDSSKRDRKPKPIGADLSEDIVDFLSLMVWGKQAQQVISDVINPAMLSHFNKKNLRSLSSVESKELEAIKFKVLCNLEPFSEINQEKIYEVLKLAPNISQVHKTVYDEFYSYILQKDGHEPTLEEERLIQSAAFALCLLN